MEADWNEQVDYFDDFKIKSDLLRGIYAYGYERPSGIQRKAILPILQGFDIIAQAQSGTGKSASFIIPLLQLIDEDLQECQAILLAPTQDLAQQLFCVMRSLADFLKVSIHVCHKTASLDQSKGTQILVGTPEKILKMLKLEYIRTNGLKIIALDEADELIGGVEKEETKEIFDYMDENIQVAMFSTTMPDDRLKIAKKYTRNAVMILIKREELMLERIAQYYVDINEKESKSDTLVKVLHIIHANQVIIYCNEKETVNKVSETLSKNSLPCLKIDNTMVFADREVVLKKFRTGECRIIVTTGVLSRGIDIQQVSVVINYDLPLEKDEYIHRIGRSNRFSKRGYAVTFVTSKDIQELRELEEYYNTKLHSFFDFDEFSY